MVDIKLSPPREGVRGGREQFKWEDLKSHDLKDREHYLGHSVKVGLLQRKNKFYKHDWYLKKDSESLDKNVDEIELTKRYEEEMMKEMLGVNPKRLMLLKSKPTDPNQLKELLDYNKDRQLKENSNSNSRSNSKSNFNKRSRTRSRSKSRTKSRTKSRSRSRSEDIYRKHNRGYRKYKEHKTDKYRKTEEKCVKESDRKTYRSQKRHKRTRSHERSHHSRHRNSYHSYRHRD